MSASFYLYPQKTRLCDYLVYLYPQEKLPRYPETSLFDRAKFIQKSYHSLLERGFSLERLKKDLEVNPSGRVFFTANGDILNVRNINFSKEIFSLLISYGYQINLLTNKLDLLDNDILFFLKNGMLGVHLISGASYWNRILAGQNFLTLKTIKSFLKEKKNFLRENNISFYLYLNPVIPYLSKIEDIFSYLPLSEIALVVLENFTPSPYNFSLLENVLSDNYQLFLKIKKWFSHRKYYRKYFRNSMYSLKTKFNLSEILLIQH